MGSKSNVDSISETQSYPEYAGGNIDEIRHKLINVMSIVSTSCGFEAHKEDDTVIAWGCKRSVIESQ